MGNNETDIENVLNSAESAQDARDAASRERVVEKDQAHQQELSGTSNRMERFGVGPESQARVAARAERSRTNDSFHAAMMAQAYAQPVTFRVGGRNVAMSLGDMRTVASDRYNHYATQLRQLKNQGSDQEQIKAAEQRMNAYRDLMDLTDAVAAGKAPPEAINDFIEKNDIGQEIVDAALAHPDIEVSDAPPTATEKASADQTIGTQTASTFDAVFGRP